MTHPQKLIYYIGLSTLVAFVVFGASEALSVEAETLGPVGIVTIKLGGPQGVSTCSEVLPYYKENGLGVVKLGIEYPPIESPWGGKRYQRFVKDFTFEI